MNTYLLQMDILDEKDGFYNIKISFDNESGIISFSPSKKELNYITTGLFIQFLKLKEFQLRKLLHNKKRESFFPGFSLNFVLNDSLPDIEFYDRTKITILNNLENNYIVSKVDKKTPDIPEIYTDGSFIHSIKTGGYTVLIKDIDQEYSIFSYKTVKQGNNLIELTAVLKGLELLKDEIKIRIITDSQYVIKGITEWTPIWKLNNWFTANGTKTKNITEWKKINILVKNKYIEFEWVKSHSNHFENTICDITAKSIAKKTYRHEQN